MNGLEDTARSWRLGKGARQAHAIALNRAPLSGHAESLDVLDKKKNVLFTVAGLWSEDDVSEFAELNGLRFRSVEAGPARGNG